MAPVQWECQYILLPLRCKYTFLHLVQSAPELTGNLLPALQADQRPLARVGNHLLLQPGQRVHRASPRHPGQPYPPATACEFTTLFRREPEVHARLALEAGIDFTERQLVLDDGIAGLVEKEESLGSRTWHWEQGRYINV